MGNGRAVAARWHAARGVRIALLSALTLGSPVAHAGQDPIVVLLDRAKVVKLPETAQTLIIGNPIIADVTLLKGGRTMVITGKGFGETNLVVLDAGGNLVTEEIIKVKTDTRSLLVVQRGTERESYSCAPRCEPTVQLGDSKTFFPDAAGQITSRNGLATPSAAR